MLKKMLHYDFKAILKFWWIGLLSTLVLSLGAGLCGSLLTSEKDFPDIINIMSTFVIVIAVISLFAFLFMTSIMIYVRYYKNLFSDEGYLTFTLPLKRSQVLNSKFISGLVMSLLTMFAVAIETVIGLCIAYYRDIFNKQFYNEIKVVIEEISKEKAFDELITMFALILIIVVTVYAASLLFTFLCITVGSVITRKNKVATAIGIYYGATAVLTFAGQIFALFGMSGLVNWGDKIIAYDEFIFFYYLFGAFLVIIFFVATIAAILYAINYWLLDKKLNLS